jgi:hypothetical protein
MSLIVLVRSLAGLAVGGLIGLGFGLLQQAALRRNKQLQDEGGLSSGWTVMPGSFRRVAYLMIGLLLVQIICPLLFVGGTEWWVSSGLLVGYGLVLFQQLRKRDRMS